jgi:hypothetical protein
MKKLKFSIVIGSLCALRFNAIEVRQVSSSAALSCVMNECQTRPIHTSMLVTMCKALAANAKPNGYYICYPRSATSRGYDVRSSAFN